MDLTKWLVPRLERAFERQWSRSRHTIQQLEDGSPWWSVRRDHFDNITFLPRNVCTANTYVTRKPHRYFSTDCNRKLLRQLRLAPHHVPLVSVGSISKLHFQQTSCCSLCSLKLVKRQRILKYFTEIQEDWKGVCSWRHCQTCKDICPKMDKPAPWLSSEDPKERRDQPENGRSSCSKKMEHPKFWKKIETERKEHPLTHLTFQ